MCLFYLLLQVAWLGHDKVTHADGGPITGKSSASPDGTQLMDAVNDSDVSSDDELFGLLDKSVAEMRVSNGGGGGSSYTVSAGDDVSHGVQQYVGGNMSSMLSGISISQSTPVQ